MYLFLFTRFTYGFRFELCCYPFACLPQRYIKEFTYLLTHPFHQQNHMKWWVKYCGSDLKDERFEGHSVKPPSWESTRAYRVIILQLAFKRNKIDPLLGLDMDSITIFPNHIWHDKCWACVKIRPVGEPTGSLLCILCSINSKFEKKFLFSSVWISWFLLFVTRFQ